jgi:hypothetical protein
LGLGTASVSTMAKARGGVAKFESTGDIFRASVLLPLEIR